MSQNPYAAPTSPLAEPRENKSSDRAIVMLLKVHVLILCSTLIYIGLRFAGFHELPFVALIIVVPAAFPGPLWLGIVPIVYLYLATQRNSIESSDRRIVMTEACVFTVHALLMMFSYSL